MLVEKAGIQKSEIACVGISNQRETSIAWDKTTGKPLALAIVWQCARAKEISEVSEKEGYGTMVPGFARAFFTSTARRTWYDGIFLTLDRPIATDGRWGFNFAYTYAEAEQTGTDNPGEGVAFGAFDYGSPDDLFRFPGTNDERHRVVASGIARLPFNFQVSSLITLGSGTPFTIFDDSTAPFTVRWNEGRPPKDDFIIQDFWAYRSVDLRLEWQAPPIGDAAVSLIGEDYPDGRDKVGRAGIRRRRSLRIDPGKSRKNIRELQFNGDQRTRSAEAFR
jgi:hypothetical protein